MEEKNKQTQDKNKSAHKGEDNIKKLNDFKEKKEEKMLSSKIDSKVVDNQKQVSNGKVKQQKNQIVSPQEKDNNQVDNSKIENKSPVKNDDKKITEAQTSTDGKDNKGNKKETKKKPEPKIKPKEEAVAKGRDFHASKKHCIYVCSFIKNKSIDKAMEDLQQVIKMKIPVPMKGEIPHRKGKIMSGRYPVKTAALFIPLLKALKGNVLVNQMDLDKTRITNSSASWASRPLRRGWMQGKRTNVTLTAKEIKEKKK